YPEQARNSYLFRVATLLCIFGFVVMRPGLSLSMHDGHPTASSPQRSKQPVGYAMEKPGSLKSAKVAARVTPSLEQRRVVNATETSQSVDRNYLTGYYRSLCRLCSQKRPARQKSGVALPKRKPPSRTVRGRCTYLKNMS